MYSSPFHILFSVYFSDFTSYPLIANVWLWEKNIYWTTRPQNINFYYHTYTSPSSCSGASSSTTCRSSIYLYLYTYIYGIVCAVRVRLVIIIFHQRPAVNNCYTGLRPREKLSQILSSYFYSYILFSIHTFFILYI